MTKGATARGRAVSPETLLCPAWAGVRLNLRKTAPAGTVLRAEELRGSQI